MNQPLKQLLNNSRIVIENVTPELDAGRYPIKREVGGELEVQADIFRDGHDMLAAVVKYRKWNEENWHESPMRHFDNDRWTGLFPLADNTSYIFTVEAWTDRYGTWCDEVHKKHDADVDVKSELLEGADLIRGAASRAEAEDKGKLQLAAEQVALTDDPSAAVELALSSQVKNLMDKYPDRCRATHYEKELEVVVDRVKARFAAWYELFPRSQAAEPGVGGTFRDCIQRLPDIQRMGFDVIYLPPIHPIGHAHRKGKNNSLEAGPTDPGSPWAIGSRDGGHKSIEPSLGSAEDFRALVKAAHEHGIEIALDFAIQCSPDHPYVTEHPEWFYHRPDGTIKYAENPPKKYQDIYPVNFDTEDWAALWDEMKSIILCWAGQGVKTFRVDNPHTKPVRFWEWLIREVKKVHPDVIFLAEAFTRPKMMKVLAKSGFTQSYTYFTWRNEKEELEEYLTELTKTEMVEYYRGNFFANTPDILHAYLQKGGRPAFKVRCILAATMSSVYGIYSGFEFCENTPLREGSEEYLDSEKYEIKYRDWDQPGNIKDYIARINQARRENEALQLYDNPVFHECVNPQLMCYSKATLDLANRVIVVVNLDPHQVQEGMVELDLAALGLDENETFSITDVITDNSFSWKGSSNFVRLDPKEESAHLLVLQRGS